MASSPYYASITTAALTTVAGATGTLHHVVCDNSHASDNAWISFFAASDAIPGTTAPVQRFKIPANDQAGFYLDRLKVGSAGLYFAVTLTATGSAAPSAAVRVSIGYS